MHPRRRALVTLRALLSRAPRTQFNQIALEGYFDVKTAREVDSGYGLSVEAVLFKNKNTHGIMLKRCASKCAVLLSILLHRTPVSAPSALAVVASQVGVVRGSCREAGMSPVFVA